MRSILFRGESGEKKIKVKRIVTPGLAPDDAIHDIVIDQLYIWHAVCYL